MAAGWDSCHHSVSLPECGTARHQGSPHPEAPHRMMTVMTMGSAPAVVAAAAAAGPTAKKKLLRLAEATEESAARSYSADAGGSILKRVRPCIRLDPDLAPPTSNGSQWPSLGSRMQC